MKKSMKFLGAAAAAFVMLAASVSASAESAPARTFEYGGYECFESDGGYCTYVNGVKCFVLSPSEDSVVTDEDLIAYLESAGSGRSANSTYDISDGSVYSGSADLSSGNVSSPTFTVDLQSGDETVAIGADFSRSTTIKTTFYYKLTGSSQWRQKSVPLSFSTNIKQCNFLPAPNVNMEKCYIMFLSSGTTVTEFDYEVFQNTI